MTKQSKIETDRTENINFLLENWDNLNMREINVIYAKGVAF
jgi:hypothetical protein